MTALLLGLLLSASDGLATDNDYEIASKVSVTAGHASVALSITPKNGFHLSGDTPLSVALQSDLAVPAKIGRKELVDAKAAAPAWKLDFDAPKSGSHDIKADFVFFLCSEKICQRMTATRTVTVAAK